MYVADFPGATVADVEEPDAAASVKSWPVPLRATLCGLSEALSEMLRVPVLVPPATGLKVTEMVQLAPALTVVPQVLVWEKSPLAVTLEMVSEALPVSVRVTLCAALLVPDIWSGKVSEEDDKLTRGTIPVPLKLTVCGLLEALSVKFSEALRLPVADGVNVTLTVQVPLGITVAPVQVSALLAKSLAFVPPIVTVEMVRLAVPVLVTVSAWAALVVPVG